MRATWPPTDNPPRSPSPPLPSRIALTAPTTLFTTLFSWLVILPLTASTLSRMSATSIDTSQATDASSTLSGMTTVVYSTVSNSIVQVVTTTSYSGAPVPSGGVWQHTKQPIPVAPIAGGAAGGVFLAVAVVVAWVWWGKCIKRRDKKEKKEAVRVLLPLFAFCSLLSHDHDTRVHIAELPR